MVEDVRPIRYRSVSKHPNRDHLLLQVQRLVLGGDQVSQLLIAGGDISRPRDVEEQGREHEFQCILITPVYSLGPIIFNLLELLNIRRRSGRYGYLDRGGGRAWNLCQSSSSRGEKYNRKTSRKTSHTRADTPRY